MNPILHINLGGMPFTIDQDAFDHLDKYMTHIRRRFEHEEGHEDIVYDIECRMAELINERLSHQKIVTYAMVDQAIDIMGRPDEFADEFDDEHTYEEEESQADKKKKRSSSNDESFKIKTGKRLYKDPDDKIVSGVASGIAAYLGINDPLWIRLAFVALAIFSRGIAIPLYIILMIILKEPKTAKEKLEMRGKVINLHSLTEMFHSEMNDLTDQLKDITGSKKKKKKKKKKPKDRPYAENKGSSYQNKYEKTYGVEEDLEDLEDLHYSEEEDQWAAEDLVTHAKTASRRFGENLEFAIKGFIKVVTPLVYLIGGILVFALSIAWLAIILSIIKGSPVIMMMMPTAKSVALLGLFNISFVVIIPVLALILVIISLFFGIKFRTEIAGGFFGFWLLNVISLSIVGTQLAHEYSTPVTLLENLIKEPEKITRLHIETLRSPKNTNMNFGNISVSDDKIYLPTIEIDIEASRDEYFHLIEERKGYGKTDETAKKHAFALQHERNIQGDTIKISDISFLPTNSKYRGQQLNFILQVPEGKYLSFDKKLGDIRLTSKLQGERIYRSAVRGQTLTVKDGIIQFVESDDEDESLGEE